MTATVHDPVCHMDIDPTSAAGTSEYEGATYYFCSMGCKRDFDEDPAGAKRFLAAYWKSQQWIIDNQKEAAAISEKISKQSQADWLAWEKQSVRYTCKDQAQQMSDKGAYPVMDIMVDFMFTTIKKIDNKPKYREWVRQDLLAC